MKKYLLTLTLTVIWFISFTNATDYNLTSSNWNYNLNSITINTTTDVTIWDYVCNAVSDWMNAPVCWLIMSDWNNTCNIKYLVNSNSLTNNCTNLNAWTYTISRRSWWSNYAFDSINISILDWNNEWWTIIQWWIDTFTPVISRMLEIAGEFIPYIVYIFIWYLGVILLWNAVKYILWYLKKKSREEKNERYRKRRQQKSRDEYRNRLIEYAKHWYDVEDERKAHWYWRRHG